MKPIYLSVLFSLLAAITFARETVKPINIKDGVAIHGYDVVAYYKDSKPVKGNENFQHTWNGSKWYFSSEENRKAFAETPEKYAPQYGGYCAYAASRNYIYDADPNFWKIVNGKLYLNYNNDAKKEWEKDVPGNIQKGDANWPELLKGKETK